MDVVTAIPAARHHAAALRERGRLGLVPTMGALHDGHSSLVSAARRSCEAVAVSIFVNPLQFGPAEDYGSYPRNLDYDLALLDAADVDLVWTPHVDAFTRAGATTRVTVGGLTERLEGEHRPGHFDGVTTIVAKLLHVIAPDAAYFGEKDFQQLAVVRRMVRDLDVGVEIVGCPIVRDPDGLALSSRNAYLSADERVEALALSRALRQVAGGWDGDADAARAHLTTTLRDAPGVRLDYAEVCDPETLEPLAGVVRGPAQALVAAHVGPARLIDNIRLEPKPVNAAGGS